MAVWGVEDTALFWEKLGILAGLTLLYILISAFLYKKMDKRVRIAATLEVA
jgi:ABC-2 type transport system permease protein